MKQSKLAKVLIVDMVGIYVKGRQRLEKQHTKGQHKTDCPQHFFRQQFLQSNLFEFILILKAVLFNAINCLK